MRDKSTTGGNDEKWTCYCTIAGYHSRTIYSVKWCKSSGLIATGSADNSIHIFKVNNDGSSSSNTSTSAAETQPMSELLVHQRDAHEQDVNCVDWCPSSDDAGTRLLASCSDDGTVKIWQFTDHI